MAVDFAGGTDEVKYNDNAVLSGSPTIGAVAIRFKTTSVTSNVLMMADWRGVNSREGFGILLNNTPGKILVLAYDISTNQISMTGATTVNDGNEHLLVYNWNGNSGGANSLWVDGNSDATANSGGNWVIGIGGTSPINLGKGADAFWGAFAGTIYEMGMWSRQLASAEISALQKGFSMGRVAYDKMTFHAPLIGVRNNRYNAALTVTGTTISAAKRPVTPYFC